MDTMDQLLPPPLGYRKNIPLYYPKSESEIKADSYEIYNPNVIRSCRNFYEGSYGTTLLEKVQKHLTGMEQAIVEMGCGSGYLIGNLASSLPDTQCVGLDYSYQMLKMGVQFFKNTTDSHVKITAFQNGMEDLEMETQNLPNVLYALSDACVTPLPDDSVDLCFSCFLFDRVADPAALIREKIRIVKPGGHLIVISPFNYLSSVKWEQWYPVSKVIGSFIEAGVDLKGQEHFTIEELLDTRGNRVVWEVESLVFTV